MMSNDSHEYSLLCQLPRLENLDFNGTRPGKLTKSYGKSLFLMGKFTINGPFSSIFNSLCMFTRRCQYVLSDDEEIALKTEELAKNAREAQGVAAVTGLQPVA